MPLTPLELTKAVRDISVTERNSFKKCRRQWYLDTILNLEPRGSIQWYFDFGTGIHSGLEAYYLAKGGIIDEDPKQAMLDAFELWFLDMDDLIEKQGLGSFESDVRNELLDYKDLGEVMLWNYHEYASLQDDEIVCCVEGIWTEEGKKLLGDTEPPYDEKYHPILHESGRFLVPILEFEEGEDGVARWIQGEPYLSSRLDLVIWKRQTGKRGFWVRDHKTSGGAPSSSGIEFDDQVTGYGYTFWRHTGIFPRGTEFNYLIKQAPKEPRYVQINKGNPSGLSTAKDQLTLPDLYKIELEKNGLIENGRVISEKHAECYAALRAHGWDRFFQRHETPRNEHEYRMFEQRIPQEYADMIAVKEDPERKAYPHLSQYNCPGCRVAPICQAIEDGSDYEFVIENRFQEAPDRKAV